MAFTSNFETHEAEAARLAQSPVGSTNHALSLMPVKIRGNVQDLMIELPALSGDPKTTIVVVPMERNRTSRNSEEVLPRRRYNSSWTCIVIASDHTSYPVQGYRITVPEYQLVRGTLRTLQPVIEDVLQQSPLTIENATQAGLLRDRESNAVLLGIQ